MINGNVAINIKLTNRHRRMMVMLVDGHPEIRDIAWSIGDNDVYMIGRAMEMAHPDNPFVMAIVSDQEDGRYPIFQSMSAATSRTMSSFPPMYVVLQRSNGRRMMLLTDDNQFPYDTDIPAQGTRIFTLETELNPPEYRENRYGRNQFDLP